MWRIRLPGATAAAISLLSVGQVRSQQYPRQDDGADIHLGYDYFTTGSSVLITRPVGGDVIGAGQSVVLGASVGGDAVLAGGSVSVEGRVAQDLYAAGGEVTLRHAVAHNARLAGGRVTIAPNAEIGGNASIAGGELRILGPIHGYLQAIGRRLYIDAAIGGDVDVTGGEIALGPHADIDGQLRYASDQAIRQAAGAQIRGGIERRSTSAGWLMPDRGPRWAGSVASWFWTFGLMLLAAVFVAVLPVVSNRVATTLQAHLGKSLLIGFGILVGVPIAIVVCLITVIGLPLAMLSLLCYLGLLLVGYVSTGIAVGDWALRHFRPAEIGRSWRRIGATALAVLVVAFLGRIPVLGTLVCLVALLAGVGALILALPRRRPTATSPIS